MSYGLYIQYCHNFCETHFGVLSTTNISPEVLNVCSINWDLGGQPCRRSHVYDGEI